jgi:hypothetical protein
MAGRNREYNRRRMRRLSVLAILFVAIPSVLVLAGCRGEQPQTDTSVGKAPTTTAPPPAAVQTAPPKMVPVPPSAPRAHSSALKCAGDGSYGQAVDCFRMAAALHFTIDEPHAHLEGEMARKTAGAERMQVKVTGSGSSDGAYTVEPRISGLAWTRNGKPLQSPPTLLERTWQHVTIYLDPQKKERKAQLAGTDTTAGVYCNIYRFTNANNGDRHEVWVSRDDGSLMLAKVESTSTAFPSMTMTVR